MCPPPPIWLRVIFLVFLNRVRNNCIVRIVCYACTIALLRVLHLHTTSQDLPYNAGEYEFESGQMVVDRARAWDALLVAAEINRRYSSYYRFMYAAFLFPRSWFDVQARVHV